MNNFKTIIFDLGGVLVDWNPRYVFHEYFDNNEDMEWFFENICTNEWNLNQDKGYSMKIATEEKISEFPKYKNLISQYYGRWEEMLRGEITETVLILNQIKKLNKYKILALTNWSHETFPIALRKFKFLNHFEDIIVSGIIKMVKPDKEIYNHIINKHNLIPSETIFIDDNLSNIKGAKKVGLRSIHYKNSELLRKQLEKIEVL